MPIYEYLCEGCAYKFEVKQSIKDDPIAVCDRCGKPVKRLISSPAIMFKGSGWYVTDYSDKLKPPSAPSEGESVADKKEPAPAAPSASSATTSASPSANASTGPSTSAPASTSASTTTPSATTSSK